MSLCRKRRAGHWGQIHARDSLPDRRGVSMPQLNTAPNRRVLVVDDNEAIHADFQKILAADDTHDLSECWAAFFDDEPDIPESLSFQVEFAFQGKEGLEKSVTLFK